VSIALSIGNNLTTGGVFTADAVNNTSVTNVTDFASVPGGGALKLLSTQTASASASLDFTTGIDSTYDSYVFKFIDIHPSAYSYFRVNFRDGGASYDAVKTSSVFTCRHKEDDGVDTIYYSTASDLAQSTNAQNLTTGEIHTDNDSCFTGYLHLFNPSSTTFVKHYIARTQYMNNSSASETAHIGGYCNTTSAIDGVQFTMSTGNIDAGIIKMYGVV